MLKESQIQLTQEEEQSILLIYTRIQTANQALRLDSIPEEVTSEKLRAYIFGVCDSIAQAEFLRQMWHREISKKYNIPINFVYQNYKLYVPTEDTIEGQSCGSCG